MSRVLFGAFMAAFMAAYGEAFSPAASQAWVTNYVAKVIGAANSIKTNGINTVVAGDIIFTIEEPTDAALRVQSATSSAQQFGVTNGMLFVWNGAGKYINNAASVESTSTNLVFAGVGSTFGNGLLHFQGYFDAAAIKIQPSISLSVTNGVGGVR